MLIADLKDTLKNIEAELKAQTDRGVGIIGAAIVDDFLTDALVARLIVPSKAAKDCLFNYEKRGPLADFSAKINIGHALGILSVKMRNDLDLIRRIRNRFAHQAEPLTFSDKEIASWCTSFETPLFGEKSPRKRNILICSTMSATLAITATLPIKLTEFRANPDLKDKSDAAMRQILDRYMTHLDSKRKA